MKFFWIIFLALFLILVFIYLISLFITRMIVYPHRYSRLDQTEYNKKMGYDLGTEVLERKPISFILSDGYKINGDYNLIPQSNKYCILVHGHGTSREGALRYALIFYELGYNTIIYDQRSHGDNVFGKVTMGYQESKDLCEIINQVYQKFGDNIILGLQGVSMGGATVLLSTRYQQKVDFIVSDCAYAKLENVIGDMLKKRYLWKQLFLPIVNLNLKLFYGWTFKDVSVVDCLKGNKIPILTIHGSMDKYVNIDNGKNIYDIITSPKDYVTVNEAEHAASITIDRALYKKSIDKFLRNNKIGTN